MAGLTRQYISDAVGDAGWRLVLGSLVTSVRVGSVAEALAVASHLTEAAGDDAASEEPANDKAAAEDAADQEPAHNGSVGDEPAGYKSAGSKAASGLSVNGSLAIDVRRDRVVLILQSATEAAVTEREIQLAHRIAAAAEEHGLRLDPEVAGSGSDSKSRSVQVIEIAIDALDIAAVRPFWRAVLAYADESGRSGPKDPIIDPIGQGPAVWFQQMDEPRPQRNRIHIDVSVPHDEAPRRIEATLAAGGRLVYETEAPAFWVFADPEGNEACITTWQGRD
jgi:4a-hydroxytetrahydrobiopterin dehydratase